jgi:predicted P-loop ATPase
MNNIKIQSEKKAFPALNDELYQLLLQAVTNNTDNSEADLDYVPEQSTVGQAQYYLKSKYEFRKNVINGRKEYRAKGDGEFNIILDYDTTSLWRELNTKGEIKCSLSLVENLLNSDFSPRYNPLTDYFQTLPEWDNTTDYIHSLAETVETKSQEFWRECLKRWLVALVASVIDSKIINHTVLVLSGGQNIGKTTWIRTLLPNKLSDYYYTGNINPRDKDTIVNLSECIIINLDELDGLKRSDLELLKDTITKDHIRVRKVWKKEQETLVRIASFAATVNSEQFLTDTTGSRRFLCNRVTKIQLNHNINMNFVFSQALALYRAGYRYWFDSDETSLIEAQNSQFQEITVEEDIISTIFTPCEEDETNKAFYSSSELCKLVSESHNMLLNNIKVGKIMNKLGFSRVKKNGIYKYRVKARAAEVIN